MPPDVFLMLASSGLTLIASLMFFVSDERPPAEPKVDPKQQLACCLPPRRARLSPPPLPRPLTVSPWCEVSLTNSSVMTFRPGSGEWEITLDVSPVADAPTMQVHGGHPAGNVHDLRWHGRAGMTRAVRRTWKQKPGRA